MSTRRQSDGRDESSPALGTSALAFNVNSGPSFCPIFRVSRVFLRRFANWRSVLVYRRSWRRCDVGVGLTAAVTMQATSLPSCDVRCNAVNPLAQVWRSNWTSSRPVSGANTAYRLFRLSAAHGKAHLLQVNQDRSSPSGIVTWGEQTNVELRGRCWLLVHC